MIVVDGEALVDLVPKPGGLLYQGYAGGSPANTAVTIARLGTPVALLARLAGDHAGRALRAHLTSNGVDLRYAVAADESTSLAVVDVGPDGSAAYGFYVAGTADWQWQPADLPDPLPADVVALHLGSLALALAPGADLLATFARREAARRVVSLDPNVRAALAGDRAAYRRRLEEVAAKAQVVKASEEDLGWLYPGEAVEAAAQRWQRHSGGLVVLTRGPAGVSAWTATGRVDRAAEPVPVVDTVGAGDSFAGGLLDGLYRIGGLHPGGPGALRVDELDAVLAFAARVAAVTCSRPGADPPYRRELDLA